MMMDDDMHHDHMNHTDDDMHHMDMDMDMEMVMTFQDWDEYKVTILWDSWEVKEKWQYALSWFAIVLAAAFFHAMRWGNEQVKKQMITDAIGTAKTGERLSTTQPELKWRVLHALIAGASYGYALMLMLVAMTYNPGLLCALMTGYALGDFVFPPTKDADSQRGIAECCT